MPVGRGISWNEWRQRKATLDALISMETVLDRLRPALCDPGYRRRGGRRARFDWVRFAREAFPEVTPPPEPPEIFLRLRDFMPDGCKPPRRFIWWALRAFVGTEDPDGWLLEQRRIGRPVAEIVEELNCGLRLQDLYAYVARCRKMVRKENAVSDET